MNFYEKPQFFLILSVFEELNFAGDYMFLLWPYFYYDPIFSPLFCLSVFLVVETKRKCGDSCETYWLFHKPKGSN